MKIDVVVSHVLTDLQVAPFHIDAAFLFETRAEAPCVGFLRKSSPERKQEPFTNQQLRGVIVGHCTASIHARFGDSNWKELATHGQKFSKNRCGDVFYDCVCCPFFVGGQSNIWVARSGVESIGHEIKNVKVGVFFLLFRI